MAAPHQRKIELQSPADFTYLYANTVALSRQKLDQALPPSANNDEPDPMRERVKELVDEYINRTFTTASASISINGIDSSSPQFPFPAAFTAPETVEYEAYDAELASRVTSLYAQLESLTTTVAQLRRGGPQAAARDYAAQLTQLLKEEDEEFENLLKESETKVQVGADGMDVDTKTGSRQMDPSWKLDVQLGTTEVTERWQSGDMADVYEDALRTLQRLQGEGEDIVVGEGNALATTVGKAERAGRAAEVVEGM
ncbi:hypothetical protein N7448_006847 [Penicillium atrosanguineum]|uniref:Kinetochore protein mis14 n=1 Tax=Penicillium atrosanguineum TaxID=1132637 RepID=A0A9W9GZ26_9EURO|nr:uncharacterized protein N7443_010609 [Penicillium atrosanguineum]KAJ5132689.1 hypothetical protein N7448_006847 [Penicillium atrosanguineum]KAJ5141423.1 hypothetical protein N7526_002418 [Penicillium atrosanguineum]KAJ5290356.1 hypothetical protein N7443_010609 [Penicillium atrosanguineum]KAJ5308179.1 hypothetical protein N7476_008835 [Penicillium atrosanguineum]